MSPWLVLWTHDSLLVVLFYEILETLEAAPTWRLWHTGVGSWVYSSPDCFLLLSYSLCLLPAMIWTADLCHMFRLWQYPSCPSIWSQYSWTEPSALWAQGDLPFLRLFLLCVLLTDMQKKLIQTAGLGEIMLVLGDNVFLPKNAESRWNCTFSCHKLSRALWDKQALPISRWADPTGEWIFPQVCFLWLFNMALRWTQWWNTWGQN